MFHGIVVDKSLKGTISEDFFKVLMIDRTSDWGIKLIEVEENELFKKIPTLQKSMDEGTWYEHFYDENDTLIVVFKERYFVTSKNRKTWDEVLNYGKMLNIPEKQLEFWPINFGDEERKYFNTIKEQIS